MVAVTRIVSDADGVCSTDISHKPVIPSRTSDPRPDLHADIAAWMQLLVIVAAALGEDDTLFGPLLGLRCCATSHPARAGWLVAQHSWIDGRG